MVRWQPRPFPGTPSPGQDQRGEEMTQSGASAAAQPAPTQWPESEQGGWRGPDAESWLAGAGPATGAGPAVGHGKIHPAGQCVPQWGQRQCCWQRPGWNRRGLSLGASSRASVFSCGPGGCLDLSVVRPLSSGLGSLEASRAWSKCLATSRPPGSPVGHRI